MTNGELRLSCRLVAPRLPKLRLYRQQTVTLQLVATLLDNDTLTSRLLPDFSYAIATFFR